MDLVEPDHSASPASSGGRSASIVVSVLGMSAARTHSPGAALPVGHPGRPFLSGRQEWVDVHIKEPEHDWEEDLNTAPNQIVSVSEWKDG